MREKEAGEGTHSVGGGDGGSQLADQAFPPFKLSFFLSARFLPLMGLAITEAGGERRASCGWVGRVE